MDWIFNQGRFLFAAAIAASGMEQLVCAYFGNPVSYIIPFVPKNHFLAYLLGTALLLIAVSIAANIKARLSAILMGVAFLLCFLILWIPTLVAHPFDISLRTVAFETLAFCGPAFALAGCPPADSTAHHKHDLLDRLIRSGPYLFAISSVIFGIDHFLILRFIASLVPSWIPGGMFWAVFTGAAFLAVGISIAAGWLARWAAFLLGVMFLLWFFLLHSPRVVIHPHNPNEWSSAFIALGISGGSWICAGALSARLPQPNIRLVSPNRPI